MWSGGRGGIESIDIPFGNNQDFSAANAIFGGAGGGIRAAGSNNGGTSIYGGNGGTYSTVVSPIQNGQIPGGGGAAGLGTVSSGAGGQGQIIIEYW
jgi:hypothetical protein